VVLNVSFQRPDGQSCNGYLNDSAGSNAPGVVVIQEWWGVNDQIQSVADRLAAEGFRVLVPDLYHGKVTLEDAEASHLMNELDFAAAASQDIRGAVQRLEQGRSNVGVIGFCMGGALAVLTAAFVPEAKAAVSWYGLPPLGAEQFRSIRVPLQLHRAAQDGFFTPEAFDAAEAAFKEGNVTFESYEYDAVHAFGNEDNPKHDAELTKLAWQRSVEFLKRYLA
jgi:carboxymethylenebutenolidase